MKKILKRKVMALFIGMMVIVLFVSTTILYVTINHSERGRLLNEIDEIMEEKRNQLNNIISSVNNCGNYVRYDDELVKVFNSIPQNEYDKNSIIKKMSSDIEMIYKMNLDKKVYSYSTVFFVNELLPCTELMISGKVCELNNITHEFRIYTTNGISETEWFKETIDKNGILHTHFDKNSGRLYVSQMIMNEWYVQEKEKYLGVAVVYIDLYEVLEKLESIGGYSASAAIISGDEVILKTVGSSNNTFNSNRDYVTKTVETDIGLKLVASISSKQLGMKKQDLINVFSIYIIVAVILTLILSSAISKSITEPITNLAQLMRKIKKTEIENLHIEKVSNDEVGDLYDSFNYMTDTISALFNKVEEEINKRYELEFKLYQNRINPHMLYNTLDTISWIALLEGNDKIVEMNKLLADIYRYSIKYTDSMAKLSEELECVKKYIMLQRIRNEYSIILDIIGNEYDNIYVPQCILQPIIENSIVHGGDVSKGELIIRIRIAVADETASITIEDNGKGCDINEVNKLFENSQNMNKVGLKNVNARIKLKFGDKYGLRVENGLNGGTKVVISIPVVY